MKFKKPNLIILLALIMLALTIYNVYSFRADAIKRTREELSYSMKTDLDAFENWVLNYVNGIDLIESQLNQLSLSELNYSVTENKYLAYDFSSEFKHETYIGFTNGSFTSNTDWSPPMGYDPRVKSWYIDALEVDKTVISNIYIDHISNNSALAISTPLYLRNELVGVLGTDLYLDDLTTKLLKIRSSDTFEPFVINSNGLILADTSNPSLINKTVTDHYDFLFDDAPSKEKYISAFVDNHCLYTYYYSDRLNWFIGAKVNLDDYTHPLSFWIHPQTIINILFWILFMWVLFYIQKLSQQLIATTKTLEQKNRSLEVINTELETANNALAFRAEHDGLTGLYNRFAFDDLLNSLISKGFQEQKQIGLILFDVDDFKSYNDIYGHVQGDVALSLLAKEVSEFCHDALMTARYGGEEFALLYYDRDIDELDYISNSLLDHIQTLRIPHKLSDHGYLTISGGIHAILPSLTTSRGMFVHKADTALYKAKSNGKNQFIKVYSRE